MQTISLPAGGLPVADIPALLARAKYPPVPSERIVSYLLRKGARRKWERPLSRLANDVLCRVWACAPLAWEEWTEAEWARRAADFDRSPLKPKGWAPVPVWRNDELNAAMLRADAEGMYRDELNRSIARGELMARNHAGLPSQGFPTDTVDAELLRAFAVRVGALPAASENAPVWHPMPLHGRLLPRTLWRGGRITETDLLTLQEAAVQAGAHAGTAVTASEFLRAGARGEIALRAVVHRTAETRPAVAGVEPLNEGRPVPAGSIPTLPLDACRQLANIGRATWRVFEHSRIVEGQPSRFIAWKLAPNEPDYETTPDDCRVTGHDVHALADAFAPENDSAATERLQAERTSDEPHDAPESVTSMPDEPGISVACLATRKQIQDAFGVWGFKASWFDNMNDRQWLKDARKRIGQGQRGQVVEPLFCPYEVMQGLVKKVRRKRMTEAKGWGVLEHKFPRAYDRFSVGDPRERTG